MSKVAPFESEHNIKEPLNPKAQSKTCCTGIVPLNVFIVSIISIMILSGCILVWLSSYIVTEKAIDDLSTKLINESGQKIITYIDGVMTPIAKLTKTMAREYTNGVVTIPMFRNYLFPNFVEFGTTGCGYFFNVPLPSRYAYTISGTTSNPLPVFTYQPFGYPGTIRDIVNITTGDIVMVNSTVDLTPYVPANQDFYIYTLKNYYEKGLEGIYGEPYKVLGTTVAIYYSQLMFDPEIYKINKTKAIVGLSKVNLSLETIVNFLSKIIFDVKSRNAGSLMKQFYELNNNTFSSLPSVMKIVGKEDGVNYIITPYKYVLENMQWNIFFVLYESEVTEALILTTSISIGVTVAIIILGIVGSFVTGLIVSRPMKFLENQLERIKVLDLESVSNNSSMFREVNSIFNNLKNTVEWLAEIKTFVPESVFAQIQNEQLEHLENQDLEKNADTSRNSISTSNVSRSHFSSKSAMKKGQHASNIFKMGLSKKGCAIIHVKIDGLSTKLPENITTIFGDIVNLLGPIVKLSQGNLNIFACDEFQLSLSSNSVDVRLQDKAFDAALKIVKAIEGLQKKIVARVGVSIGEGYVGNIGSSSSRYFSMVGPVSDQSKIFSQLACKFNVKILTDDSSISSSQKLVYRPLDRILKELVGERAIYTVFEVIALKLEDQDDEWLYSLENSKKNNKFQNYSKVFDLFTVQYWTEKENLSYSDSIGCIGHALETLKQFSEQEFENQDISCNRIIACLGFALSNQQSFKSSESISKYLTTYSNWPSFELVNQKD